LPLPLPKRKRRPRRGTEENSDEEEEEDAATAEVVGSIQAMSTAEANRVKKSLRRRWRWGKWRARRYSETEAQTARVAAEVLRWEAGCSSCCCWLLVVANSSEVKGATTKSRPLIKAWRQRQSKAAADLAERGGESR